MQYRQQININPLNENDSILFLSAQTLIIF